MASGEAATAHSDQGDPQQVDHDEIGPLKDGEQQPVDRGTAHDDRQHPTIGRAITGLFRETRCRRLEVSCSPLMT